MTMTTTTDENESDNNDTSEARRILRVASQVCVVMGLEDISIRHLLTLD